MIAPPETKAASAPPRAPANQNRNDGKRDSISRPQGKPRFDERQSNAEENARQLVAAIAEHGRAALHGLPLECFPTSPLADIAERTLAATDGGARGFADVMAESFMDAPPHVRSGFVECNEGFFPPSAEHCKPLADSLRAFHVERRKREIFDKAHRYNETGEGTTEEIDGLIDELAKLKAEAASGNQSLRERAYSLQFNPDETPPPDETCMVIGDIPIAARGNLTVPQGKSKVGKSAVVSAVMGAAHRGEYQTDGDTLCIEWKGEAKGAIIHMDTEQSRADWHALVCRGITRSGMPEVSPRLVSLPLVMFSRGARLAILKQTLAFERERQGVIDLVMIDGVADLCISPNDEAEALELVSQLHALAQEFDCPIFCVLHENPGSEIGKTRGHLGSELNRKAFANLRIDKDTETSVSTIYGTDMRKRDIPREQGFCFAWDTAAGMHTFQGRAAGLKAAHREAEAIAKARTEWERIFEFAAEQRENPAFPALTPKEAAEIEKEISGKENLTKADTMKKRMQKAESLGVLRKPDPLRWVLIPAGTAGKQRENGNHSRP